MEQLNVPARVGSTEWLAARRIKYDPTGTGRPRYTHEPTGQAAVRQPYMDDEMWQKEIESFGRAMERETSAANRSSSGTAADGNTWAQMRQPMNQETLNGKAGRLLTGAPGSAALTLATLSAIAASIPKTPVWRHCTLTPENFERLRHDPEFRSDKMPACGIEIHVKHGQVADSWMFSDSKTLRKYLAGELSELDLMGLMETGACQPNAKLRDAGESGVEQT